MHLRTVSQGILLSSSLSSWKFALLALLFAILQDHKLHQGTVTTTQAASNLNLSNALLCIAEPWVPQGFTSGWSIYYLDQEVVLNSLQESLGLSATHHATTSADIRVVEIPHQNKSL